MLAKLIAPRVDKVYPRHHLYQQLDHAFGTKMIWLAGAAGSGKTTLLASYLATRQKPHVWFQLDEGDADPATFFYYLGQAIQAQYSGLTLLPLLTPEYLPGLSVFARNYFRELASRVPAPFVLVLDNYQELPADSVVHELVNIAAAEFPPGYSIVVASRNNPPENYARLKAYAGMHIIEHGALQMTLEETQEFCAHKTTQVFPAEMIARIHAHTQGWITGVLLLLGNKNKMQYLTEEFSWLAGDSLIFEYFSAEIFSVLDEEAKELSLRLALLPNFTHKIAEALLAQENKNPDLLQQVMNNHFLSWHGSATKIFQFHPLYKEFLRATAIKSWSPDDYAGHLRDAARLLAENNMQEEAIELLLSHDETTLLESLLVAQAGVMLAQGRYRKLRQLLDILGDKKVSHSAWLCYWSATSYLPFNILESRRLFESAHALFKDLQHLEGIFMAWSGIVQTYHYFWDGFAPLDHWIKEAETLLPSDLHQLTPRTSHNVITGMFSSIINRQPDHPDLHLWRQRAEALVDEVSDVNSRLDLASKLLLYYLLTGDFASAKHLVSMASPLAHQASPLVTLYWWSIESTFHWLQAEFSPAVQTVENALALVEKHGFSGHQFFVLGQGVYALLTQGKPAGANTYLDLMPPCIPPSSVLHQGHYHYLAAYQALLSDDIEDAQRKILICVNAARQGGAVFPIAMTELGLACIESEMNHYEAAIKILDKIDKIARSTKSALLAMRSGVIRADIAMKLNSAQDALNILRETFAIGAAKGILNFDWWIEKVMARLCALALSHGIEPGYTRKLIRLRGILPASPSFEFEDWPWPIRIYTLGRFSLLKENEPVTFSNKVQKKPLELLRTLIALGGKEVHENTLMEALWPDAEGDQAKQNLKATVHRVRKLLEVDVLRWHESRLTLDSYRCWVDVSALERLLNLNPDQLTDQQQIIRNANQIFKAYQGPFLQDDDACHVLGMRERLRSKILRQLEQMSVRLFEQNNYSEAIAIYLKALEIEPLSENFYQGLMRSYIALGQLCNARNTYERCKKMLHAYLGLAPTPETEEIAQSIK